MFQQIIKIMQVIVSTFAEFFEEFAKALVEGDWEESDTFTAPTHTDSIDFDTVDLGSIREDHGAIYMVSDSF